MNVNTGHLISHEMFQAMGNLPRESYIPLPQDLQSAAEKKLAGKPDAMVSLQSGGKLSKWAAEQRKKKGKSGREKMAKESRRRNRHG